MRKLVAIVKPFGAQDQRNEENLYLPNPSPSYIVAASPAPSTIDLASPLTQRSEESDNESVSSDTSYSQGMHTSGDDTDNEVEPLSMDLEIDAAPSVEYLPPPSVEEIPQALVQEVDDLQNLPVPQRVGQYRIG